MAKNGCDSSIQIHLHQSALKTDFDVDSSKVPVFSFFQKSINHVSFIWHFGDGFSDNKTNNPSHTYQNKIDSIFKVCLIATDSLGCKDTLCKKLNVYSLKYFIYNTFTPNQDGYNDQFTIGYNHIPFKYSIEIFSRWGTLVYNKENADISNSNLFWNGQIQNNGPECPSGSYFVLYKFYLNGENQAPTVVNGVITLIR
jgi:gliding motility-associated-like protein